MQSSNSQNCDRNSPRMDAHAEVVKLLDQLRDRAKVFSPKVQEEFNSVTDSIETLTKAYMAPEAPFDWSAYQLTMNEARMAGMLYKRMGKVCTKSQIFEAAYYQRPDDPPDAKIIDVFLCKIRKKLRHFDAPYNVETVWGIGYRMVDAVDCSFESAAADYVEASRLSGYTVEWKGINIPRNCIKILDMLSTASSPLTAEALSAGQSISNFHHRLNQLRGALVGNYEILCKHGVGYYLQYSAGNAALQALRAA